MKYNNQYRVQIFANSSSIGLPQNMSMFAVPIKCAQILAYLMKEMINKKVESKLLMLLFDFHGIDIEIRIQDIYLY